MWAGAMPAERPYSDIALYGSFYWFGYFIVILPLLGLIEKPKTPPATIEDDFNAKNPGASDAAAESREGRDDDQETYKNRDYRIGS